MNTLVKVYRVQDAEGLGPYFHHRNLKQDWCDYPHISSQHPEPFDDKGLIPQLTDDIKFKNYKCGFESLSQLKNWFSESEIARLEARGFKIVVLEIKENLVLRGEKQVLFYSPENTLWKYFKVALKKMLWV